MAAPPALAFALALGRAEAADLRAELAVFFATATRFDVSNFSLPFDWLGRNGPNVGVAIDVLSQETGPFEASIQQLTEALEVQLLGVKRVFETRFVGINNLVGSGNDE